jgi:inhibitor of cysteine peptidase
MMRSLQIAETERERTIELVVDEPIELLLNENPTTGYVWHAASSDEKVLQMQDVGYIATTEAEIGAGGVHRYVLTGARRGHAAVQLQLARPWESKDAAVRQLRLSITVK